jgi:hypothetical protein
MRGSLFELRIANSDCRFSSGFKPTSSVGNQNQKSKIFQRRQMAVRAHNALTAYSTKKRLFLRQIFWE